MYSVQILSCTLCFNIGILQERDAYLPLAQNGSRLFFVILDLAKINNMYRFSLAAFLRLFQRSLDIDNSTGSMDMRIKSLNGCLQKLVYEYVCRYVAFWWVDIASPIGI